jgi:hypothetical protein
MKFLAACLLISALAAGSAMADTAPPSTQSNATVAQMPARVWARLGTVTVPHTNVTGKTAVKAAGALAAAAALAYGGKQAVHSVRSRRQSLGEPTTDRRTLDAVTSLLKSLARQ